MVCGALACAGRHHEWRTLLEQLVERHRRDPSVIGAPPPSLMTMLLTALTHNHNVDRAHRLLLDAEALGFGAVNEIHCNRRWHARNVSRPPRRRCPDRLS
jgi:hypothetical protein